jgi:class II lanthipeptide synthase
VSLPSTSTSRPDWADFVEQAIEQAQPAGPLLRPLLDEARDRVARGAPRSPELIDLSPVCDQFTGLLDAQLTKLVGRMLGHHTAGLAALLAEYPVLARLLAQTCLRAVDAHLRLLDRLGADRDTIVEVLFGGVDPGPLREVGAGGRRGRTVLRFADGRAVVYQPRSPALLRHFGELTSWLNKTVPGLALRPVTTVVRPHHGWVEFVPHRPCASVVDVDRFYRRQGALLALLYAVDAADLDHETLVAAGDQPVLVDVETLFHPALEPAGPGQDPATRALRSSVIRTGLLPLAYGPGRPRLGDQDVDPAEYRFALLTGFRAGYDAIDAHRDELAGAGGLLQRCRDDEIRVVVRPTGDYSTLLAESTRPDLLRDDHDRARFFERLRTGSPDRRLVEAEIAALVSGAVPALVGRPCSRDAWTPDGEQVADLFDTSGLDAVAAKIAAMDEVDRLDQEWLIAADMATRARPADHRGGEHASQPAPTAVPDAPSLLAAACGIADQLVARSLQDEHRANWLGLELTDGRHWTLAPLGARLGEGYPGVALFLAQLGTLTDTARYLALARKALRPVPGLLAALDADPGLAGVLGPGGFAGLGGLCYTLSRMTTLLGDPEIMDWLTRAVDLVGPLADRAERGPAGVATGDAGGMLTMLAVHAETGLASAHHAATAFASRLADAGRSGHPSTGFADGSAGVAHALRRFGAAAPPPVVGDVSDAGDNLGWCTGLSGLVLAADDLDPAIVDDVVTVLAERRPLRDASLCHGELGIAEALSVLARRGHTGAAEARVRYAARAMGALGWGGPRCGTPNGVPSPGLLTGLAGIGYGLLRLGFADRVPSVLLLENSFPAR